MESIRQSSFRALTSADVALETIIDVLHVHPDCGTIALLENQRDQHGVAMPIEGPDPGPEHLLLLHDLILKAVGDDAGCRIVLASIRPGAATVVSEDDLEVWRRLRRRHEGRAPALLDWFVVGGEHQAAALSLAEIAGPPPQWD